MPKNFKNLLPTSLYLIENAPGVSVEQYKVRFAFKSWGVFDITRRKMKVRNALIYNNHWIITSTDVPSEKAIINIVAKKSEAIIKKNKQTYHNRRYKHLKQWIFRFNKRNFSLTLGRKP